MKKIKFIPLLFIAFSLIVTSCAIDDDDPIVGTEIIRKTVSLLDDAEIFVAKNSAISIGFVTDKTFSTSALVEYTIDGDVGSAVRLSTGNTSGNFEVSFSIPGEYIITLSNVSVLNKPFNVDAVIDASKKAVKITVLDVEVDPDALQIILDWENPAQNDLDLYVTDDPIDVWYERSWTITPQENISFSIDYPDDTYNISPQNWSSADNDVNISMFVVHPNGVVEIFEGTINNIVDRTNYYFVKFVKVGDQFTMTQVPIVPLT